MTALIEMRCGCSLTVDQDARLVAPFDHRIEIVTACPAHAGFRAFAARWLERTPVNIIQPAAAEPEPAFGITYATDRRAPGHRRGLI
jgi:hypothetical protein